MSNEFVLNVYHATRHFPREEMFGITSQIRKAAVSVPANIVEGCARETAREYLHFLNIAFGSLMEVGYLLDLSNELGYIGEKDSKVLKNKHENISKALNGLMSSLKRRLKTSTN